MTHDTDTLISGLVDELEAVRPLRFSRGLGLVLGGIALTVLLVAVLGGIRSDIAAGHPEGIVMLSSGLFLVLGLACTVSVVTMGSPHVGSSRNGWIWAAAMAGVLPFSAIVLALIDRSSAWQASQPGHGAFCLVNSIVLGLLTAGILVLWLRRGAPTLPERAGLLTGMAAGCAGVFAVSLACPVDTIMHIGLWHGFAVPLSGLAGRLVVPFLVRW